MSQLQIAELDLGIGNISSVKKAFQHLGVTVHITNNPEKIMEADAIVIPGDGNFSYVMEQLLDRKIDITLENAIQKQIPILGICIGFQIFFSGSQENYDVQGLSYFYGDLSSFSREKVRVPHIGWAKTFFNEEHLLTHNIPQESYFYYIHSYRYEGIHSNTIGYCNYETKFTSIIAHNNIYGVQFHPEKSDAMGLQLLKNFVDIVKKRKEA